ncbi:MAG: SPOR domain-containing protein [Paracoccaceae bacterium]
MADIEYDDLDFYTGADPDAQSRLGAALQQTTRWAGALTSVALVAGLGIWGYKLVMRDVTGIPVVRALEGPMRMAPADPGGEIAAHQGLAVNTIAAEGEAAPPPDRLVLAPPPVSLAFEDRPAAPMTATKAETGDAAELVSAALAIDAATSDTDLAVAAALGETTAGAEAADAATGEAALAEDVLAAAPAEGGLATSPRPVARPDKRKLASASTAAGTAAELDPAGLAVGTRLVQLGAFDDAEAARNEWGRLQTRFGELMAGKSLVVQQAESGGHAFYRLRAEGFADEADARRFCSALLSENAACIPVVIR